MAHGRPYSEQDDRAIVEAFTPRSQRVEAVARSLGRTTAAVTRRYYRLLAEDPEANVGWTGPRATERATP